MTFFRDTRPLLHAAAPVCSCCTYFQLFLQAFVRPPSTPILRFALKRNTPHYTDTTGGIWGLQVGCHYTIAAMLVFVSILGLGP